MNQTIPTMDGMRAALELERRAPELQGVRAARIETADGAIRSVRLLVVPERDESQVVGCFVDLAQAATGIRIDPSIITVLRAGAVPGNGRPPRRRLASLGIERVNGSIRARVALESGGDLLMGEVESGAGAMLELRAVAHAVLDGVDELLDFEVQLEVTEIQKRGDHEIAMVTLVRDTDRLVGAALVRTNPHEAVARATLDALNRFLSRPL